jgi:hypothetical protein
MLYVGILIILIMVVMVLRASLFPRMPHTVGSLGDAERLVDYHIQVANRRLRRDAWMLTFVIPQLDLERRQVTVRIGINYQRRGYPDYIGQFQQAWANAQLMLRAKEKIAAAFAKRGFQATVETFT